jgi:hypothetical protein
MAFNNTGQHWLKSGESGGYTLRFGPEAMGSDHGAQWMMAVPLPFDTFPTPWGLYRLVTDRHAKQVLYANGGTDYTYTCEVHNEGVSTFFTFTGGGNV